MRYCQIYCKTFHISLLCNSHFNFAFIAILSTNKKDKEKLVYEKKSGSSKKRLKKFLMRFPSVELL
jgi:hypothetical protein